MTTNNTQQSNKNSTPLDQETLHFDQDFTEKTTSPNDEDTLLICDHDDLLETKVIKVSKLLTKGDTNVIYGKLDEIKENQILAYKEGNIANVEVNNLVNSLVEKTSSPDDNDTLLICDNKDLKPKKIKASTLLTKGNTAVVYAKLKDMKDTQILSYKDGNITNVDIKDLVNFSGFVLKHSVDTIADLAKDFPKPQLGWASLVKKADLVHYPAGVIYIYTTKEDESGNDWIKFDMMGTPNIVEDLDMNNFDIKNLNNLHLNNHLYLSDGNQAIHQIYADADNLHFIKTSGESTNIHCNAVIAQNYNSVLEKCYPIGSIYTNATNNTNPKDLLGFGTWESFGAGRVPVGFDDHNDLFNTSEKTGGNTDTIIPQHTHNASSPEHFHFVINQDNIPFWGKSTGDQWLTPSKTLAIARGMDAGVNVVEDYVLGGTMNPACVGRSSTANPEITVTETGNDPKNANLPPYITVYMWKRIS